MNAVNGLNCVISGYTVEYIKEVAAVDDTVTPPIFHVPLCGPHADGTHCITSAADPGGETNTEPAAGGTGRGGYVRGGGYGLGHGNC